VTGFSEIRCTVFVSPIIIRYIKISLTRWIFYECRSRWKNNRALLFFIIIFYRPNVRYAMFLLCSFFLSLYCSFFPFFPAALSVQLIESFICIWHKSNVIEIVRKNMHRFVLGRRAIGITASVCRVCILQNLKNSYFELSMWREWPENRHIMHNIILSCAVQVWNGIRRMVNALIFNTFEILLYNTISCAFINIIFGTKL